MRMNLLKTTELIRRILLDLCLKSVVQYIAQLLHMKNMYQNSIQNVTDYGSILVTHIMRRILNGSAINLLDVMPWQPLWQSYQTNVDFHKTIPITLIGATEASILSRQHFSYSQIMAVTGHTSVSSLAVYQRVSNQDKLQMGLAVSDGVSPTASDAKRQRLALPSTETTDPILALPSSETPHPMLALPSSEVRHPFLALRRLRHVMCCLHRYLLKFSRIIP